jgi:hypothetical protein
MKYSAIVIKFFLSCLLLLAGIMCANAQESAEPVVYNKAKLSSATEASLYISAQVLIIIRGKAAEVLTALKQIDWAGRSMECWATVLIKITPTGAIF